MVNQEPQNPIRCMFCPLIVGSQALNNHMMVRHKDERLAISEIEYEKYRKAHVVKKSDINHPLRFEWRKQNNIQ